MCVVDLISNLFEIIDNVHVTSAIQSKDVLLKWVKAKSKIFAEVVNYNVLFPTRNMICYNYVEIKSILTKVRAI